MISSPTGAPPAALPSPYPGAGALCVAVWPPALGHGSAPAASPGSSETSPPPPQNAGCHGGHLSLSHKCHPLRPHSSLETVRGRSSHWMPSEHYSMPPCPALPRAVGRCPPAGDRRLHLRVANPLHWVKLVGCYLLSSEVDWQRWLFWFLQVLLLWLVFLYCNTYFFSNCIQVNFVKIH